MLSPAKSLLGGNSLHSSAQKENSKLPNTAILWDVLRSMEGELQRKGLLPRTAQDLFNPLWFLAETERNVFLWRHGCGLTDKDRFEFWIDIPKLIEKRLKQLQSNDYSNPFINPLWEEPLQGSAISEQETEYLLTLIEVIGQIEGHAHALSHVGSELRKEFMGEVERVLLPGA